MLRIPVAIGVRRIKLKLANLPKLDPVSPFGHRKKLAVRLIIQNRKRDRNARPADADFDSFSKAGVERRADGVVPIPPMFKELVVDAGIVFALKLDIGRQRTKPRNRRMLMLQKLVGQNEGLGAILSLRLVLPKKPMPLKRAVQVLSDGLSLGRKEISANVDLGNAITDANPVHGPFGSLSTASQERQNQRKPYFNAHKRLLQVS